MDDGTGSPSRTAPTHRERMPGSPRRSSPRAVISTSHLQVMNTAPWKPYQQTLTARRDERRYRPLVEFVHRL
ncbi:hypothetical protein PISMIDRAFT_670561 [Pisolithus microcarpus 441]|uniref:Uncharacterized protein n=1 Tax=Pisolithus microcarpus 441 TaxID=765257 RepID=A0A0D0AEL8_9AGAM|nr:hypothetical protein PISMIDRAFT_670561 [Pisolithus microcarpus 441]